MIIRFCNFWTFDLMNFCNCDHSIFSHSRFHTAPLNDLGPMTTTDREFQNYRQTEISYFRLVPIYESKIFLTGNFQNKDYWIVNKKMIFLFFMNPKNIRCIHIDWWKSRVFSIQNFCIWKQYVIIILYYNYNYIII